MIVRRSFHPLIRGKRDEAIALLKSQGDRVPYRIYTSETGPSFGTLCIEMDFETLADLERYFAEFHASPEAAAFWEKWYECTRFGAGHAEIWNLE